MFEEADFVRLDRVAELLDMVKHNLTTTVCEPDGAWAVLDLAAHLQIFVCGQDEEEFFFFVEAVDHGLFPSIAREERGAGFVELATEGYYVRLDEVLWITFLHSMSLNPILKLINRSLLHHLLI